jgi:hypothetical protein
MKSEYMKTFLSLIIPRIIISQHTDSWELSYRNKNILFQILLHLSLPPPFPPPHCLFYTEIH